MKRLTKLILIVFTIALGYSLDAANISSKSSGGDWTDKNTWVGGVVPGSADNVTINGTVAVYNNSCNNITISSGATLTNRDGYSTTLDVNGDFTNNGFVINTNASLYLNLYSDLYNAGTYYPYSTVFKSGSKHEVSQASGKYFEGRYYTEDTVASIVFTSDVEFRKALLQGYANYSVAPYYAKIETNGYNTYFNECEILQFRIVSDDEINFDKSYLRQLMFYEDVTAKGSFTVYSNVYANGGFNNQGTIKNRDGYSVDLWFNNGLINEGTITNNAGGILSVKLGKGIENKGVYQPYSTTFRNTNNHIIKQSAGKFFEGKYYAEDTTTTIILGSDVEFRKALIQGAANYSAPPYYSKIVSNGYTPFFNECEILQFRFISGGEINFDKSYLRQLQFVQKDVTVKGVFTVYDNIYVNVKLTNLGTISNREGYGVTLYFNEDLINKGSLMSNAGGGNLYIQARTASMHNSGVLKPQELFFRGDKNHLLSHDIGKPIEAITTYIESKDTVTFLSNVNFYKSAARGYSGRGTINTNGHSLRVDSVWIYNLNILGSDTVESYGAVGQNISFRNQVKLNGVWELYDGIVFEDSTTNVGAVSNRNGYGVTVTSKADFTNLGTISNNSSGALYFQQYGEHFHNAGQLQQSELFFRGDRNHLLSHDAGKPIETSTTYIDSKDTVTFLSNVNFYKSTAKGYSGRGTINTNGHNLKVDSVWIYNLNIFGSDTVESYGAVGQNISFRNQVKLNGVWELYDGIVFEDSTTNVGAVSNRNGYGVTVTSKADFTNLGMINNNTSGGLYFHQYGEHFHNAGTFKPSEIMFRGDTLHYISQEVGKPFEAGYHYFHKNADSTVLLSDVTFNKGYVRGYADWANITTNGHKVSIDTTWANKINFYGSDTFSFGNTYLQDIRFHNKPIIDGTAKMYSNVRFMDDAEIFGIMQNREGYGVATYFEGKLINNGTINVSGGGNTTLYLNKGLENEGNYDATYTYLVGKDARTIKTIAEGLLNGKFYVDDTLTLLDENYLPHLQCYSKGLLTIDTNASLVVADYQVNYADSRIINLNRISVKKPIDYYYDDFHRARVYFHDYSKIGGDLEVESYANQQHPSTQDALPMWWRFKPDSTQNLDAFNSLELIYEPEYLPGLSEDSIRVFFSPNAGISWEEVTEGKTIDTANNKITLDEAKAYGHYVISSSALGVISFEPLVQRAEPKVFGNKGKVTLYGFGLGFTNDMTVYLTDGTDKIYADSAYITDALGESFLATFSVELATVGEYSMVVQVPGYDDITLTDYFTIEEAERPDPWVMLSGRDRFLVNRFQTFRINFGNRANMDAEAVPLFFMVNDVPGMEVEFPDFDIGIQKSFTDDGWNQFKDTTIDLYYVSDEFAGYEGIKMRLYPFIVPSIGAMSADNVRVRIKVPTVADLDMSVWITDPLAEGLPGKLKAGTPPEVAACLAAAAAKYTWDKAIGLVPGYDCYKLAYKVGETTVGYVMKDPKEPPKKSTWFGWINTAWGWTWSVVECAGDIIPVGKGVKVAKELIDFTFETKGNYDAQQECWDKFRKKKKGQHKSKGVFSFDPNEITGPDGYGTPGYIDPETNMVYTVFFENKDSATAPASEVVVLDTLDKTKFDFSTFSFQDVTIADSSYEVQSFAKEFRILLDMAPRINTLVQVTGALDTATGEIRVQYLTLDRSTLELQEDVDLGFLPPNKEKPEGEGNFAYSVALKDNLPHDTYIENKALIFFDANKPIKTNVHANTIDILPPTSMVDGLPAETTDSTFVVSWGGTDPGAGIENYTIMVSVNDSDFVVWRSNTSLTSDTFYGNNKTSYAFYSVATDSLGLTEGISDEADASTYVKVNTGNVVKELQRELRISQVGEAIFVQVPEQGTVRLFDLNGRFIKSYTLVAGRNTLSAAELAAQAYVAEVTVGEATVHQKILLLK
jgi:hypothetical protein